MTDMPKAGQYGSPVLAMDIGGTKIITAIITDSGQVVAEDRCLTLADEGVSAVINRLFSAIDNLLTKNNMEPSQLGGISMAAAGAVDSGNGWITFSPNLPGWKPVTYCGPCRRGRRYHYRTPGRCRLLVSAAMN